MHFLLFKRPSKKSIPVGGQVYIASTKKATFSCPLKQVFSDSRRNLKKDVAIAVDSQPVDAYDFSLRNQLGRIKLSDDAFQDFISDRRQNTLVIVAAERLVDSWQVLNIRSGQHTQGDGHHLKIF